MLNFDWRSLRPRNCDCHSPLPTWFHHTNSVGSLWCYRRKGSEISALWLLETICLCPTSVDFSQSCCFSTLSAVKTRALLSASFMRGVDAVLYVVCLKAK